MRALSIAICLAASTPAFAAEIYPSTGSALPPQPSLFVEGTPELTLNVTSNDRLVAYTVVPTDMAGIVRVDVALAAGPLRIGHDERGTLGEYVVAESTPHRLKVEASGGELALATDAVVLRVVYGPGPATAMAPTQRLALDPRPDLVVAMWSDRTEEIVLDRPLRCGASLRPPTVAVNDGESSRVIVFGLMAVLAGLGLAIQRRVSRGSSAW
jgi:hypothetical protein